MDPSAPKYWAFISYSHRDAKIAATVQRALETYRLPPRLVGRQTALGEVPAFLKPIFRDRDELQAGADLDATVRAALSRSRFLIVVCSPEAARSEWVGREIVEFKKLHGESRVLALIASGEPFASRVAGRESEECFPEALRFALAPDGRPGEPLEPLAADLRPQGDGKRRAILKLVAGMLGEGVGVDELVRRDAQRKARRMAAIAAASVGGMAIMAVLTVAAVRARGETQVRHAQAEDLLEFMLGDLRRKLDPVGRLDALDSVGEKALAYYASQEVGQLDPNALGRRSRAMHLIGEIREQRGRLDEALAAFTSAAATTAQLLARAPGDGQRIFDHAQSTYWVGYIAWRRGDAKAAEDAFLRYRELAHRLVRIDAGRDDWQLETAYASQNLGVVQLEGSRLADALRSFTETRDAYARLVAKRPAVAFEVADAQGWIAKVHEASGDYGEGIGAQLARLAVLRGMPDAAKDTRVRRHVANANFELARLRLSLGEAAAAERDARAALEEAEALEAADRTNLFWQSEACFDRLRLAEIELALGRREAAKANVERAGSDAARLIASDASMLNWQVSLDGLVLAHRARIAQLERRDSPGDEMQAYLAKVRRLEESGKKLTASQAEIVARIEMASGDHLDRAGRRDAARERWQNAKVRLDPHLASNRHPVLTLLAGIRLRLGELAEARALAARVEASKYRHPAYAGLVEELSRAAGPGLSTHSSRRN